MPVVVVETFVAAPIERCYDMARDIDIHTQTVWKHTRERAVDGVTSGMIGFGETVTFEATHFWRQRLTSKIVEYDRPYRFVDEMQKGSFKRLKHIHDFIEVEGGTLLTDTLDFAAPLGPLGWIANQFVLKHYMKRFILARNRELKKLLETNQTSSLTI